VHIRGWNWSPSSAGNTSQIAWGFASDKVVGTITISGDGTFSETIKVPDGAPVGKTTIDVDGDFTLGRPLDFEVTRSSAASAELDGPSFVYPKNGQTLNYEGAYLFKVKPVPGASGYLWGFFQGGKMVWENYRYERKLSGTEYAIRPRTPAHKKFVKGKVAVWVRGLVNGKWTKATIITIYLRPKVAPPRTHTPATPTPVPKPPDTYVALGDSFSSGEGAVFDQDGNKIADYEPGTDYNTPRSKNVCHRTKEAFAYKVRKQLSADVGQTFTLKLKACSGAVVQDYFDANDHSAHDPKEPAQNDDMMKDNPQLVTLTFGGNDIGFATILRGCVTHAVPTDNCIRGIERAITKTPSIVHTHNEIVWDFNPLQLVEKPKVDKGLFELYSQLLDDAPQARIMVLGYPRLYDPVNEPKPVNTPVPAPVPVPGASPNPYLYEKECSTIAPLETYVHSRDEQKKANELVNTLNKYIADTVTKVNNKQNSDRLVYVNVSDAFKNGGICAPDGKRLVNLFVKQYNGARSPQQSFHPNAVGQTVLAQRVVECYSDRSKCETQ
jgi:lysophospholipase L1-like esterase